MKTFVIYALLATVFAINLCKVHGILDEALNVCLKESNVTDAELKVYFEMNSMTYENVKDNMKCLVKCVMEEQGLMKAGVFNGTALIENFKLGWQIKDQLPDIERTMRICMQEKGSDDCETAIRIALCLRDNNATLHPKPYF